MRSRPCGAAQGSGEPAQQGAQLRQIPGGSGGGLRRHRAREVVAVLAERGAVGGAKRQGLGRVQHLEHFVDRAHVAEALHHRRGERGLRAPGFSGVELLRDPLARTCAIIGDAAGKATRGQIAMDRAAVGLAGPVEVGAGRPGRFVDGKTRARVEVERETAERGAAAAICGQVDQLSCSANAPR